MRDQSLKIKLKLSLLIFHLHLRREKLHRLLMNFQITNQQARQIILHLQGLTRASNVRLSADDLYDLIVQLGFVQVDSIQWVERAQHMTLFARNQTYRPKQLAHLIENERRLFENWTHDASIIPSEFFTYWKHKFDRDRDGLEKKYNNWQGPAYKDRCLELIRRMEQQGSLRSRDLEKPKDVKLEMWQWHDGKAALEFLWRTGDICIAAREGFQKVYDLTHRVVPQELLKRKVDRDEFIDWACRSALERLGFGTARDIAKYWDLLSISEVNEWVANQNNKTLVSVVVDGVPGASSKTLIGRSDIESVVANLPKMPKRIRALSPFDPVIRDRKRLSWLFGFDYRIEIYVPEEKRIWGYYVFPLLEGDKIIGRIDMRAKRKENVLEVKKLWLEPKQKLSTARKSRLDAELQRQSRLAGVGSVTWLDGALTEFT